MKDGTQAGYAGFQQWEQRMARRKAERIVHKDNVQATERRVGLTRSDIPDLEQEMLLQILVKRPKYDPTHESGASLRGFLSYTLDKYAASMLRERRRIKRGGGSRLDSFDMEMENEEGETVTLADLVSEEPCPSRGSLAPRRVLAQRSPSEAATMRHDVHRALEGLNVRQREIGHLILEGHDAEDICRNLGFSRATLYREVRRMRRVLYAAGLKDYVG